MSLSSIRDKTVHPLVTAASAARPVGYGIKGAIRSYLVIPRPGGDRSPQRYRTVLVLVALRPGASPAGRYGPMATSITRAAGPRRGNWIVEG